MLTASCVTETIESSSSMRFSDAAIVSVQDSNVAIEAGSTFSWLPEAVNFYKDERLAEAPVKSIIESEIVKNLTENNMRLVESVSVSSYAIAYTAALESSLDDSAIIRRFGLLPGHAQIPESDSNVEKGSLIIYVFNNQTREVVWRSAAQVSVEFDIALEKRKQRIQHVVAEMFHTFPRQKTVE
ncbi:DUF4136 domain-containing protein [Cardiobacterium sp. AH-315-I02]|nr:DUF4136 domain-containing protein [Cardiobacterium sp. AH-315-I02]